MCETRLQDRAKLYTSRIPLAKTVQDTRYGAGNSENTITHARIAHTHLRVKTHARRTRPHPTQPPSSTTNLVPDQNRGEYGVVIIVHGK